MRVAVLGSGGIGAYYGALLAKGGHDVAFIARSPDDVAQAALYFASDGAGWTTGTILTVDGGIMAQ